MCIFVLAKNSISKIKKYKHIIILLLKVYFLSYMLLLSSILIPSYFYSLNTDWYNYSYFVQLVLDSYLTKCLAVYVTNIVSPILVHHSERGNHRLRASAVFKLIWNYFNILTTSRTVPVNIRWITGQGPEAVNNIEFPIETPFSTYILSGNLPEYRLPDLYMLSFSMLKMFSSPFDEVSENSSLSLVPLQISWLALQWI